ncbi:hypothetical protein [Pseudomonas sp.]|uniref:hypothetical protein n=1 Tax=Pseudomonas sp. TaxID=306 RepID=UPI003A97CEDA
MDTQAMLWGLVFGSVGLGFFIYGRKRSRTMPFICGLGLMLFPYFISSTLLMVAIGCSLIALPYFFRL